MTTQPDGGPSGGTDTTSNTEGGTGGDSRITEALIITTVAGWLVTNFVLQPTSWALAYGSWAVDTALAAIDNTLKTTFGSTGAVVYDSLTTPRRQIFAILEVTASNSGLGGPIIVAVIVTILLVVLVLVYLIATRYVADYIPGGSLIQ